MLTEYPSAKFSALVRKAAAGELVKALAPERITIVHGSHSDHDLIQAEVQKADLILNTADADDLELTRSIIKGLEKKDGKGILIHTRSVIHRYLLPTATEYPSDLSGSAVVMVDGSMNGSLTTQGHKKWEASPLVPRRIMTIYSTGLIK